MSLDDYARCAPTKIKMIDLLSWAMTTALLGFVTGATAAGVYGVWLMRKIGDPRAQGQRVATYLVVGATLCLAVMFYLLALPWLD